MLTPGSLPADIYGDTEVAERHRHRYEANNAYRSRLQAAGLSISGTSPDGELVEFVELDRSLHPFIPFEARKLGRLGPRGIAGGGARAQFPPWSSVLDGTILR